MNKVVEKWDEILQIVKTEHDLSDVSFNTWLKPLTVYEVVDNVVTIIVPSEQVGLNYISKKYKLPLQVTISEVTGMENCDINFILPEDVPKRETVSPKAQSQDARCEEAHLNPKYTFDTFVVGSNNKFAQAAALAVAESPGDTYNPLFIYGGAGLGKTHLMHSIAHFIIDHDENSKVLYVTSEEFTNELIETIRNGNNSAMTKFREKYRNIAKAMGVDGVDGMTLDEARKAAVNAVKKLSKDVGIPENLKDIVKPEDVDFLAQSAYDDACRPGNPRETSVEEIKQLYLSLM